MAQFPGFVRPMHTDDMSAVDTLLEAAFQGREEVNLIHALRNGRDMAGEMVLPLGDGIIGHYALSQMRAPKGWLCLAPVAIDPSYQGRGYGRRMIGQLTEWARLSDQTVVVLGQVKFYERAGFSQARAQRLSSPYPITHTLLAGPGLDVPEETLIYPKAFDAP